MAKKRKYDLKKKQQLQLKRDQENRQREIDRSNSEFRNKDVTDNVSTYSRNSRTSNSASLSNSNSAILTPYMEDEKPLHQPRPQPAPSIQSQSDLYDLYDRSRSPTPKLSKQSSTHELYKHLTTSSSALSKDKDLPLTPEMQARNSSRHTSTTNTAQTDMDTTPQPAAYDTFSLRSQLERDYSIEEINDSDDELNQRDPTKASPVAALQPPVELRHPGNDKENLSPEHNMNRLGSPTSVSHTKFQGKDVLIMSPRQDAYDDNERFGDNEETTHTFTHSRSRSHNDQSLQVDAIRNSAKSPDLMVESRSNCPSPLARANRHARVLETNDPQNDSNDLDNNDALPDPSLELSTPKKNSSSTFSNNNHLTSPPPRVPLPSVPQDFTSPNGRPSKMQQYQGHIKTSSQSSDQYYYEKATSEDFLNGLGLEGVEYNEHNDLQRGNTLKGSRIIVNPSPTVTNLEEGKDSIGSESLGRKSSIMKTPKKGLRHKRSISGGSNTAGSNNSGLSKLNFFKGRDERGHSRHVSDGSISGSYTYILNNNYNSASNTQGNLITPPLPSTYRSDFYHNRSNSDSVGGVRHYDLTDLSTLDSQIKALLAEVNQLDSKKKELLEDIKKLKSDKMKLGDDVETMRLKYEEETKFYDSLAKEVEELKAQKLELEKSSPELEDDISSTPQSQRYHQQYQPEPQTQGNQGNGQVQHLQSAMTSHKSNSSSSLLNATPDIGTDEIVEPQRATKLKFWRRAKIGFNGPSNGNGTPNYNNGNTLNVPSSGAGGSNATSPQRNEDSKGFGLISKSRSTNILDTFLNNNSNNSNNSDNDTDSVSLFNCSIDKRARYENSNVPLIVSRCIKEVEERGLDIEGIYRISGGNLTIISIEQGFSNYNYNTTGKEDTRQVNKLNELLDCDINAVTSALKRYLRKIPDPLIPYDVYNEFIKLNSVTSNAKKISDCRAKVIDKLPTANKEVLYLLCKHLELVNSYSSLNRMNYKNLSVVFAPTIARDETGQREMMDMGNRNDVTEFLLNNYSQIFG